MNIIKNLLILLFKNWYKLVLRPTYTYSLMKFVIIYLFFKRAENIKLKFWNIKLIVPNSWQVFWILIELFINDLYSDIKWCRNVLDLGWYIWESWVYLACQNKEVVIYEANPHNFKYIKKNTFPYKNIQLFNSAVTWNINQKKLKLNLEFSHDVCGTFTEDWYWSKSIDIQCKYIQDVIWWINFDGLKMDIEWAEYDILEYLLKENKFTFKVWMIEFHFFDSTYRKKFENILERIEKLWYYTCLIDNFKSKKIDIYRMKDINLFFKKMW